MPLSDADIIAQENTNSIGNIITTGAAALITYDYLLTVRRESRLFWKRKVNTASILFFVNRYLALFYYVALGYYRSLVLPYSGCRTQVDIDTGTKYLQYLPWAVFSALRVHALTQKNWFLSVFTFFWAGLAFPVNYYGDFHHRSYGHDPVLGCTTSATIPTFLSEIGTIFIRGGQIISDIVVIGVTWKATYHARSEGSMSSLMRVMFRSGTLYFIILLVLNSFHVLFVFLPNSLLHVQFSNTSYFPKISEPLSASLIHVVVLTRVPSSLTAILVSHFMLDLHETNRGLAHQGSDLSTIQIMSVDIGQPYSRNPVSEELGDLSVASNPTSSHTASEIWSESGEVGSSSIACANGNTEVV